MCLWYEHFKTVIETNHPTHDVIDDDPPESVEEMDEDALGIINEPISKEEIIKAIQNLKNGKAPGPDGII